MKFEQIFKNFRKFAKVLQN